jgi:hypothetical protein
MNDSRRREFLKVAGGVAVVGSLAGCAGEAQEDDPSGNETGDEPANESGQDEEPTEESQEESEDEEPQDEETQEGTGEDLIRVAHMIPDFPAVDVYVDGSEEPVIADLEYTEVTEYVPLGAGDHQIRVTPAGSSALTIYDQQVSVPSGNITAVALPTPDESGGSGNGMTTTTGFQLELYGDQNTPPEESISNSRIRVVHAAPDAPPVNVMVGQTTVFENVAFGEAGYYDLPAGDYEFDIVPADAMANGGGTGNETGNESDGGLFSSLAADGGAGISLLQEEENESAPEDEEELPEEGEEEGDSGVDPVLTFDATTEPNSVYTVFVTGYVDPEAADSEAELEVVVVEDVVDGEVAEAEDDE